MKNSKIVGVNHESEPKADRILAILKKGSASIVTLSNHPEINLPKEEIFPLIDILRKRGHLITEKKIGSQRKFKLKRQPLMAPRPSLPPITKKKRIEILFMSDLDLGLKTQQIDLVATCLKIGEQRNVFCNIILGNLVAGRPPKGKEGEYFLLTHNDQAEYVREVFPRTSFNTFLLNGRREMSFKRGKDAENIESLICKKPRTDIRYLGDERAIIPIGRKDAKVAVVAAGGFQAYTKSYPLQGIIENFQEAVYYMHEHSEPFRAVIAGGLHTGIILPRQFPVNEERLNDYDGVAIPSLRRITASQTVSRRRGAMPVLGCLILGANFDQKTGAFSGFTYTFYDLTAYFKDNDYQEKVELVEGLNEEQRKIVMRLAEKPARRGELSLLVRKSVAHIKKEIKDLQKKNYKIWFNEARQAYELTRELKTEAVSLDLGSLFKTKVKFVATADWHVGHENDRLDLIRKTISVANKAKVDFILNCGNLFEGTGNYPGQEYSLSAIGADAQRKRLLKHLPKLNIPMVLISSPGREHDAVYWVRSGHDVVETFVEIARLSGHKVEYLGGSQGTFRYKDLEFDLQHPKGGLPYGQTYRLQRRIETLVSAMDVIKGAKATFLGHLHRAAFMQYKGMAGFLVPGLQDTTDYIIGLDKLAELGVWVVEMAFDEKKNLTRIDLEYIPFEPRENPNQADLDDFIKKWK